MKAFTLIMVAFLMGAHFAEAGNLGHKYPIIGSRKPSLVGILVELEAKLKSGGALDTVLSFLDGLRASINEEQIRHDQLFTDQTSQCTAELDLRTKDVKDAEQVLNRATEQYENCSSSEKKAESELENNLANQKVYNPKKVQQATDTDIKILDAIRKEGAEQFEEKKQDHIDGLRALQESLKILESFQQGGASLAQMSDVALRMVKDSVKLKTTNIMAQISSIFAQMLTQNGGYLEVFERLKQLLTGLEQGLYKNLQKYQEEEDNAVSEYDDRRVHLVDYYANLQNTEDKLRDHITTMDICQDQQAAIIDSAKGKKLRNSELFDSASRMCTDFQEEYEKATAVRRQELDLVSQVRGQIVDRTSEYRGTDGF